MRKYRVSGVSPVRPWRRQKTPRDQRARLTSPLACMHSVCMEAPKSGNPYSIVKKLSNLAQPPSPHLATHRANPVHALCGHDQPQTMSTRWTTHQYSSLRRISGGSCRPCRSLKKLSRQWSLSHQKSQSTSRAGHVVPARCQRQQRDDSVSSGQPPASAFNNWSRAIKTDLP